ncbi:MAG: MotA/TolQ/ExbB proton channel family protein [Opitutaceae bacterium]|nr:MotA/TolQ/ExbB proton channel family protein [Cytophagales bacterium]
MIFFQITTAATSALPDVPEVQGSMSLLDLLFKGGWVIIPILFLSLLTIYIIIERTLVLSRASRIKTGFMDGIKNSIVKGDLNSALSAVSQHDTPVFAMLKRGIGRIGSPLKEIENSMESAGKVEILKLEKNMSYLGIVAAIAPMLGFVGTISGVIKIFYNISLADNISIGLIAGGLYEKMITSAAGLIVGIIAHTGYQLLNMKIESITYQMEKSGLEFVDIITDHK